MQVRALQLLVVSTEGNHQSKVNVRLRLEKIRLYAFVQLGLFFVTFVVLANLPQRLVPCCFARSAP